MSKNTKKKNSYISGKESHKISAFNRKITKKLEKDDGSGKRKLVGNTQTKSVEYHNPELNVGRAA